MEHTKAHKHTVNTHIQLREDVYTCWAAVREQCDGDPSRKVFRVWGDSVCHGLGFRGLGFIGRILVLLGAWLLWG